MHPTLSSIRSEETTLHSTPIPKKIFCFHVVINGSRGWIDVESACARLKRMSEGDSAEGCGLRALGWAFLIYCFNVAGNRTWREESIFFASGVVDFHAFAHSARSQLPGRVQHKSIVKRDDDGIKGPLKGYLKGGSMNNVAAEGG